MANVVEFTIRGVDKFSKTMGKVTASIGKAVKAVGRIAKWAAAAAAALVGFVAVVANGIDKTAKFATRIGQSVTELSKMQFAASQAGIASEQFNMATQRMTRRVAEATKGMGEARGALIEMGIDAKRFQGLGLEDQMATLSDRFEKMEDPADKLRIAFKLFDSEGTAMLQMLKQGGPAMRDAARDAEFLGLAISEQAAANAEKFTDSMGRATGSLKGVSRGIANELMPVLSGLANRFADALANSRDSIVSFVKSSLTGFFTFIEVVKQAGTTLKEIFSGNVDTLANYIDSAINFAKAMGTIFLAAGKAIFKGIWEGIKAAGRIIADFGGWVKDKIASIFSGKEVAGFGETMATSLVESISKARENIVAGIQEDVGVIKLAFGEAGQAVADGLGINIDLARNKAQAAIASLSEFGQVTRDELTETGEQLSEFMIAFNERQQTFMQGLRENTLEFVDTLYNIASSAIDMISQGIAAVIVQGKSLSEMFKNIAKQILAQIIAAFVKMGIQRLLLATINKSAVTTEASAEAAKAVGLAGANMFASMAAAPFPINLTAPVVAAASMAGAAGMFSAGAATGASLGAAVGAAHGGLTNVPKESTYLLDEGERVLSPNQNRDLTNFMRGGGGGSGGVTIESLTVHVLENATSIDALLAMDERQIEELVAGPIYRAIDNLDAIGVRPRSQERGSL